MALRFRDHLWERNIFCCCLPVHIGASVLTLLGIISGGILSAVLWFELSRTTDMTSAERAGFVVAGLMETLFFVVAILGLVGAIVPKQSFVQIYAYFTSGHLILNLATTTYLLYVVAHFSTTAAGKPCEKIVQNAQVKNPCIVSLAIAKWVYFIMAVIVLLIELYGALVVGHYAMQLKREKRNARRSRMVNKEAMRLVFQEKDPRSSSLHVSQTARSPGFTLPRHSAEAYNPYVEITQTKREAGPSSTYHEIPEIPALPVEAGYGGGLWTHQDISAEEKSRLKERDEEMGLPEPAVTVSYEEINRRDKKSPMGPQPFQLLEPSEVLPVYTYPDPPKIHLEVDQSAFGHEINTSVHF